MMSSGSPLVQTVKRVLPTQQWRLLRRASNRLRWLLKFRLMRGYGFPIMRRPWIAAKYMFWDPEVESYSYELANEPELAEALSPLLCKTPAHVRAWFDEARSDPYLARDRGFHWSSKRRLPLGNRTIWYPIVRAIKPRVIVEAGVHEGLGSELLLCALKRNAAEGHPGRLISFDIHEDTGWLVHPDLRENWKLVLESTLTALERVLREENLEVDLFIHETPHTEQFLRTELDAVLHHAAARVWVADSSGLLCPTVRDYCGRYNGCHTHFQDIPKDHIVKSHGIGLAVFDRDKLKQGAEPRSHPQRIAAQAGATDKDDVQLAGAV
jgi:hypothetical protein